MSRIQSSSEFASTVIECIKKYVQKGKKTKTMNVNQQIIEYQTELATLFTKAKHQKLFIHKKDVWGIDGIAAYLIRLPLVQQIGYIKDLRTVLYNLLTEEFADLIVEDTALPQTRSVPTPPSSPIKVKRFTATAKVQKVVPTAVIPTAVIPTAVMPDEVVPDEVMPAKVIPDEVMPAKVIPADLREKLHEINLVKPDWSKNVLSDDIHAIRKTYTTLRQLYNQYFPYISAESIPEEISKYCRFIPKKLKQYEEEKSFIFRQFEGTNCPLYNRLLQIDTFLKGYFPMGNTA